MSESRRLGWWALWTLATAAGYSIGLYAGFFLAHFLLGPIMAAVAVGAGVGMAQRPVLQHRLEPRRSHRWSPVDSAGWIFGCVIGTSVAFGIGLLAVQAGPVEANELGAKDLVLPLACAGVLAGYLQTRVLRRFVLESQWWIIASGVGWASSALGLALFAPLGEAVYPVFAILIAPAAAGIILGGVTGAWLVRLPLRQPDLTSPEAPPSDRSS